MIRIRADHKNRTVMAHLKKSGFKFKTGIRKALSEIGIENKKYARNLIVSGPKTGRHHAGLPNQSSAPGQAPATQSGKLEKSLMYRTYGPYKMEFGEGAPYGKYLELGTPKMKERPHLSTTVHDKQGDNLRSLKSYVEEELVK